MKILFLCKKTPFPPTDGESIVICQDLKVLETLGHEVYLFCLETNKHTLNLNKESESFIHKKLITHSLNPNSLSQWISAWIRPNPIQIGRFYNQSIEAKLNKFLEQHSIDLIIYQGLAMTLYGANIPITKFYRVHNIESKLWQDLFQNSKKMIQKWGYYFVSKSLKSYENQQLSHISTSISLSDDERSYFKEYYPNKSICIPIFLNQPYSQNYDVNQEGILFMGSLDWKPNIEGLNWFLENIYPAISEIPLTIAGKGNFQPPRKFNRIKVISNFNSSENLMANHRMMIVPLLSGAGIRIKIMEGMHFGIPILSTTIGASGIKYSDSSIILENEAKNWIQTIRTLYSNHEHLKELSTKGKASFRQYYSLEVIQKLWTNLIKKASHC